MVVSEVYQGTPLSFMTRAAEALLETLMLTGRFVPVTTRTRLQFERIQLPRPCTGYAVTTNGATLLKDGEPDRAWTASIQRRIGQECAPLAEISTRLTIDHPVPGLHRLRVAEDTFVYCIIDRDEFSQSYLLELTHWCEQRGWTVSLQGRKLYCVPLPVSKEAAVAEICQRTGADLLVAAGDSLLDAGLLELADIALRPAHGELDDAAFHRSHLTVTAATGVLAGEEILSKMVVLSGDAA